MPDIAQYSRREWVAVSLYAGLLRVTFFSGMKEWYSCLQTNGKHRLNSLMYKLRGDKKRKKEGERDRERELALGF